MVGGAIAALGAAFAIIGAPISGTAVAIAAVIAALVSLGGWIKEHWGSISAVLTTAWDDVKKAWTSFWTDITAWVKEQWEDIKAAAVTIFGGIIDYYVNLWKVLTAVWSGDWKSIGDMLSSAWNNLKAAAASTWTSIGTYLSGQWDGLGDRWKKAWAQIGEDIKTVWSAIKKAATGDFTDLGKIISDSLDKQASSFSKYDKIWEESEAKRRAALLKTGETQKQTSDANQAALEAEAKAREAYAKNAATLGIQTTAQLQAVVETRRKAYEAMKASSQSNAADIQAALLAVQEAEKNLAEGSKNVQAARKEALEANKKAEAEALKKSQEFVTEYNKTVKEEIAFTKQWHDSQQSAFESLLTTMRKSANVTGEATQILVPLRDRLNEVVRALFEFNDAMRQLGLTTEKQMRQAAQAAEANLAKVQAAMVQNMATEADLEHATRQVQEAHKALASYLADKAVPAMEGYGTVIKKDYEQAIRRAEEWRDKAVAAHGEASDEAIQAERELAAVQEAAAEDRLRQTSESYKRMGTITRTEMTNIVRQAEKDWRAVAETAGQGSKAELQARATYLEALKAQADAGYGEFSMKQRRELDKIHKQLEDHLGKQKALWDNFFRDVKQSFGKFIEGTISRLIFGGGDANKELDKQAAELQRSLEERTKEYNQSIAEIAQAQADAAVQYKADLDKNDQDLADSLADRQRDWDEYLGEVADKQADIEKTYSDNITKRTNETKEKLQDAADDYEDFRKDVVQNIEEIREKFTESIRKETEDYEDELRKRKQALNDFMEDNATDVERTRDKYATNIRKETDDTADNIADRQKDYNRYAEDTARKIAEVREKNKGQYSREEEDLQISLARKKEDLDQYIREQNQKLAEYTAEQQKRQAQEEADLQKALERKTRDAAQAEDAIQKKHQETLDGYKKSQDDQIQAQEDSLKKRKDKLDDFEADQLAALETYTTEQQIKRDEDLEGLDKDLKKKRKAFDDANEADKLKHEETRVKIESDYESNTAKLNTELGKQTAGYETFKTDTFAKLEEIKAKHTTIWTDIGTMAKGVLGDIAGGLIHIASEEVLGALTGKLGGLKKMFSGLGSFLGNIFGGGGGGGEGADEGSGEGGGGGGGFNLGGLTGILGKIPGLGKLFGGAGGMGGLGSLLGMSNPWSAAIMGGSQIFSTLFGYNGIFGQAEKDADVVNKHTLETVNELKNLRVDEWTRFGVEIAEWTDIMNTLNPINDSLGLHTLKFDDLITWETRIYDYLGLHLGFIDDISVNTATMLGEVQLMSRKMDSAAPAKQTPQALNITVTATGVTTKEAAKALGDQIATNLTTQLVTV